MSELHKTVTVNSHSFPIDPSPYRHIVFPAKYELRLCIGFGWILVLKVLINVLVGLLAVSIQYLKMCRNICQYIDWN